MNMMIIAWFELKRMATSRTVLINQFCRRSSLFLYWETRSRAGSAMIRNLNSHRLESDLCWIADGGEPPGSIQALTGSPEIQEILVQEMATSREEVEGKRAGARSITRWWFQLPLMNGWARSGREA